MPQLYTSHNGEIFPDNNSGGKQPSVLAISGAVMRVRPHTDVGNSKENPKSPTTALKDLCSKMFELNKILNINFEVSIQRMN